MGRFQAKREALDGYSEVGPVSGTSGSTLTAASLEDVRGRGSVKSHPAKHQESETEVNYREQAGCAAAIPEAASQQLFALLHLPAFETMESFCGSRDLYDAVLLVV